MNKVVALDTTLHGAMGRAAVAELTSPDPVIEGPEAFAQPHVRPPKLTPESVLAEFEHHARYCEDMAAQIHAMAEVEIHRWNELASDYRRIGQVEAAETRKKLDRLAAARAAADKLAEILGEQ